MESTTFRCRGAVGFLPPSSEGELLVGLQKIVKEEGNKIGMKTGEAVRHLSQDPAQPLAVSKKNRIINTFWMTALKFLAAKMQLNKS